MLVILLDTESFLPQAHTLPVRQHLTQAKASLPPHHAHPALHAHPGQELLHDPTHPSPKKARARSP